jgi:copper(I)-binding protein
MANMRVAAVALSLAAGMVLPAAAAVQVSGAWARATAPGQDEGAVYLSVTSTTADRLTAVSSPDAGMAMLHETTQMGGMSSMQDMDGVALPPGKTVTFAPHGMHIMLMDLKHPLTAGSVIGIDLTFEKAGTVHAQVPVEKTTATGPQG